MPALPFRLTTDPDGKKRIKTIATSVVEHALSLRRLEGVYEAIPHGIPPVDFCQEALKVLGVHIDVDPRDLDLIPEKGPVVVVANHPFGGLEGVFLTALLGERRRDIRMMANYLVARIPELAPAVIAVDPFGGDGSVRRNLAPMRTAVDWLKGGGLLVVFPAGEVSHLDLRKRCVSDPPWRPNLATLLRRSDAAVVPLYIDGRNSATFQLAGLLHPRLRTALLPAEFMRVAGGNVHVRLGRPIHKKDLAKFEDSRELLDHLRMRTYLLAKRGTHETPKRRTLPLRRVIRKTLAVEPVAAAEDPGELTAELATLPERCLRLRQNEFSVYLTTAAEAPGILREIGRLRESTFRAVGEGTGMARDIDPFDETYHHLFVWNNTKREIVGSYRMASTEDILRARGLDGLYTQSLFDLDPALFETLGPALEVGRSFVCGDYQRSYAPLLLLWKGIGSVLVERPEHRLIFGALSISNEYGHQSRSLMARYLDGRRADDKLCSMVHARHPFRAAAIPGARSGGPPPSIGDLEHVSDSVSDLEEGSRGVPVLLREYVKLGARLLGLSVDPAFGNTLDALVLIDLDETPRRLLERYLGREEARGFLDQRPGREAAGELVRK